MFPGQHYEVYIDESGNFGYDFGKRGTSDYYVVTAVIIHPDDAPTVAERIRLIRHEEFGGAELRSKSVGSDHGRRFRILKRLLDLPFSVITVVIKKKEIHLDSGLGFKRSFVKFSNNLLHKELRRAYEFLEVVSDEQGTQEFMDGFIEYVRKQEETLFSTFDFQFDDSKNRDLLQLADFVCGTIAYGYENGTSKEYRAFLNYLGEKVLQVRVFPKKYQDYLIALEESVPKDFDPEIAQWCLRAAFRYIKENQRSESPQVLDRIRVLERLLFQLQTDQPDRYLHGAILKDHIRRTSGRTYLDHQFRTGIIAPLRDSGVIIASSKAGYKIPVRLEDIYSYANQTVQVVQPMLNRLRICRRDILIATNNQLDILGVPEYGDLRAFFDYIKRDKPLSGNEL